MNITLEQASRVIAGAFEAARSRDLKPMGVMVLDSGGHPVAYSREDGAAFLRHDIARAKARGALGMGMDTRILAERAAKNPVFFGSVAVVAEGDLAFSAGGVLIRDDGGDVIGAVGVSGDQPDMDEACAIAGIEAAELGHGGQS